MDMIKTECEYRGIDFSNYIRYAATVAVKYGKAETQIHRNHNKLGRRELYRRKRGTYSIQQREQDTYGGNIVDHNPKLD